MDIKHEIITLKNQMQVVLVSSDIINSVNVSAYVKIGSAIENSKNQGIMHFIEHICANETKKWPNYKKLNNIIELKGSYKNAYTSKEHLKFYVTSPYKEIDFALELIYEMLFRPTFSNEVIKKQRSIILDEMSKSENDLESNFSRFILGNIYKTTNGYSYPIVGSQDTVSNFTKKEVYNQYKNTFKPSDIMIFITGNFKKDQIKKMLKKLEKVKDNSTNVKLPNNKINTKLILYENSSKTDLIMCAIELKTKGYEKISAKDHQKHHFINIVLCGPRTSRLNAKLREETGLLYNIGLSNGRYKNIGRLEIYFECPKNNFKKCLYLTLKEIKKFAELGITKTELDRYKKYIINKSYIEYDTFYDYAGLINDCYFYRDKIISVDAIRDTINKFELIDLNKTIKDLYKLETLDYFLYGNVDEKTVKIVKDVKNELNI